MIYTTGTVSTVSGSAIVSGTGTKWTVNNPAIRSGTIILIKNGNANFIYMVDRVNSDTELVISQPATFTVKNTSYSINLTEPNSYSDANNRMTAIASDTTYFLRAMDQWMMNNGVVTVELSNGQKVTLDSIKKMQGDIANKLDIKTGGNITARVSANPISVTRDGNDYLNIYPPKVGDGKDLGFFQYNLDKTWNGVLLIPRVPVGKTRELAVKEGNNILVYGSQHWAGLRLYKASGEYAMLETNSSDNEILSLAYRDSKGSNVSVLRFPRQDGQVMVQGDYGFAGNGRSEGLDESKLTSKVFDSNHSQIFRSSSNPGKFGTIYSPILFLTTGDTWATISTSYLTGNVTVASSNRNRSNPIKFNNLWGTSNTTTDSNGFIKRASPVININPDGTFTTNDESEGATVTRVAQGEYLIEGVLGFNSDAGWGGVDGGIEIPLDVNKQPLIWVDSKVMKDGSILVRTHHRTYPNSPKFARNDIDGYKDGDPIDIPDGRFISVRVQMPEQSIYNVRMREMEEAQKAEEERRQKEEEENQDTNKTPEIDN
ncbi:hypothetical protein [Proteus mirabilis]|uniref:phage tail fiber protein n=1 Tax=Proteus mirabilis TaxID=584 RepID=UPI0023F74119|nr:hypothetical protein [Proteus mirabilis]MDF7233669.1 hypothetical protein [Proteus mirabilis]